MDAANKKSKVSMMLVKSNTQTKSTVTVAGKSMSRMLKSRKQSYGFSGVPGIQAPGGWTSQIGIEFKRPPLLFLNTYQLDSSFPFNPPAVEKIIDSILDVSFAEHKYNCQDSPATSLRIADDVMRETKSLGFNRYRIFSVVTIGQRRAQCYNNAVSFIWDHERDSYVNTQRENNSAFVQVTVFGVYLD
ncbi:unnamed protein product [Chrysodeixis includens]|uniref:Uncharacterized protein n=1 Tax=Chrysodeixis includens TaxID=689277 RepID=A0A9N8PX99_CHRIL|nr:unnamed protein product [Chrysodeixis includens]